MEQTDRGDLRIRRVEESSYGVYACTAENELDKKTIQGNLTTVAPITIEEVRETSAQRALCPLVTWS